MEAVGKITAISLETLQEQTGYAIPNAPSMAEIEGLGAEFKETLSEVKTDISTKVSSIGESISSLENVTPSQLLKLQLELTQVTLQQELISKGVTKTTQNVDTLIKAQ